MKKYILEQLFIHENDMIIKKEKSNIYNINDKYLYKIININKNPILKCMIYNEIYFYNNLYNIFSETVNLLPFYNNIITTNENMKGIILENINNSNKFNYYENNNIIYNIIDNIVKLHLKYWNKTIIFDNKYNSNYIIDKYIKTNIKNYLEEIYNQNRNNSILIFFKNLINIQINKSNIKNKTIINGTLQSDNILLVKNEILGFIPYFRDWILYKEGNGIEDIIHLLIFSTKPDFLINNYNEIFMYYIKKVNEYIEYSIDMLNNDIKYSLLDYILYKIIELYIKNIYLKSYDIKFDDYLNNFKLFVSIYI